MTTPEGKVVEYGYDQNNRPVVIASGTESFTFTYDANGRMTSLTYSKGAVASYSYDNGSRLTGLTHVKSGTTIDTSAYIHDSVGNRLTRTDATGTRTYQYDFVYEQTQAAHPASVLENLRIASGTVQFLSSRQSATKTIRQESLS